MQVIEHVTPCGLYPMPMRKWVLLRNTCDRLGLGCAVELGMVHSWVPGVLVLLETMRRDPAIQPLLVLQGATVVYAAWVAALLEPLGIRVESDGPLIFMASDK